MGKRHILHASDDLGVVGVADVGDKQTGGERTLGDEAAGHVAGTVIQLFYDSQHTLAGLSAHLDALSAEHAANGALGNTGGLGNVVYGGACHSAFSQSEKGQKSPEPNGAYPRQARNTRDYP